MADPTLRTVTAPFLPSVPQYDLTTEPWIDVTDVDGTNPRRVGLHELLTRGHQLALDDAARGPLWSHALTRLTIALTYLVHANDPAHNWTAVAHDNAPLPTAAIDATLARLADHLWLHHPTTPFLQDASLPDVMGAKPHKDDHVALERATDPFWSLVPDVPSKSNTAWFGRSENHPTPDAADAAAAVLVRHYFALPGNEAANTITGGGRSEGGATRLTHNGRTFVTLSGPTVAATAVRNLLTDWVSHITPTTPTFLDAPADITANIEPLNPLWVYTASCAATLLIPAPHHPDNYRAVRTGIAATKATAKALAATIDRNDPHTLRTDPKTAGQPHSHVRLTTADSDLDLVRRYYRDLIDQSELHRPTVLGRRAAPYAHGTSNATVLIIDGAGGATGPRIGATATLTPPTGLLDLDRTRAGRYLELAARITGVKGSAARKVARHAHLAINPTGSAAPAWLYPQADRDMATTTEQVLRDLLTECADPTRPLPDTPTEKQQQHIAEAALALYDRIVAPHASRPAAVPHVVRQRRRLNHALTALWS